MVIYGTLGLAVPHTPRPLGETDQRKCVFLGGALARGRGATGVSAQRRTCIVLKRQGPARMDEMWPLLAPLEALARAYPAHPGKIFILASISS